MKNIQTLQTKELDGNQDRGRQSNITSQCDYWSCCSSFWPSHPDLHGTCWSHPSSYWLGNTSFSVTQPIISHCPGCDKILALPPPVDAPVTLCSCCGLHDSRVCVRIVHGLYALCICEVRTKCYVCFHVACLSIKDRVSWTICPQNVVCSSNFTFNKLV